MRWVPDDSTANELIRLSDRYIEVVLDLMDQLEAGQDLVANEVHRVLVKYLRDAQMISTDRQAWDSAQYALVSWTDEVLIAFDWNGRDWWSNHLLEVEFFGTRVAGQEFYVRAHRLLSENQTSVLRIYYVAVLLGFRGIYALRSAAATRALGLPESLDTWLERTRERLASRPPAVEPATLQRRIAGAAPSNLKTQIIWLAVACLGLITLNLTLFRMGGSP